MAKSRLAAVGLFVIGGVLLFAAGLFLIGDRRMLFADTFRFHAEFKQLAALDAGAKVRVSGVDAGEVEEIRFPTGPSGRFRVRMRVRSDLRPLIRAADDHAGQRADVDDDAVARCPERSGRGPAHLPGGEQVDVEDRLPVLALHAVQVAVRDLAARAGVVDDAVQPAGSLDRTLDERHRLLRHADVRLQVDPAGQGVGQRPAGLDGAGRVDDHAGARVGEPASGLRADPARGSGDEHDPAVPAEGAHSLRSVERTAVEWAARVRPMPCTSEVVAPGT